MDARVASDLHRLEMFVLDKKMQMGTDGHTGESSKKIASESPGDPSTSILAGLPQAPLQTHAGAQVPTVIPKVLARNQTRITAGQIKGNMVKKEVPCEQPLRLSGRQC